MTKYLTTSEAAKIKRNNKIVELYEANITHMRKTIIYDMISRKFGISERTVQRVLQDRGILERRCDR